MTDLSKIHEALGLMNSMIQCGEKHTEVSLAVLRSARSALDAITEHEETRVLLGGSRAYGTPREDSDWDLVMLTDRATAEALRVTFTGDAMKHSGRDGGLSVTVGKLNLLIETDRRNYDVWADGINQLKAIAPVTRQVAVDLFEKLEAEARG